MEDINEKAYQDEMNKAADEIETALRDVDSPEKTLQRIKSETARLQKSRQQYETKARLATTPEEKEHWFDEIRNIDSQLDFLNDLR